MGRARKNQRDAIRKQRANKRQKRGSGGDDHDDDDDDVIESLVLDPLLSSRGAVSSMNEHKASSDAGDGDCKGGNEQSVDVDPYGNDEVAGPLKPSQDPTAGPASTAAAEDATKQSEEKSETTNMAPSPPPKPLTKIERMRLKKQQQKARRKEKKAIRAAAASGTSC
mmetsp:Transcript_36948/g.89656  ORF Transcript_36948/g.89656 Transcript_36948/m.89656 type:complete len:167 (+) Transcript_36948:131-631(+)